MATETATAAASNRDPVESSAALRAGATVMAGAFALTVAFGLVLAARLLAGEGIVESGVDLGVTTAELSAFNAGLPHYIVHLRMTIAGLFVAVGLAGSALAWYGVRRGRRWAWTASVLAFVAGAAFALPLHYTAPFAIDQALHLGPTYAIVAVFVVGAVLAWRGLAADGA